jgi:hypothetical protein
MLVSVTLSAGFLSGCDSNPEIFSKEAAHDEKLERTPLSIPLPWTEAEVKAALKVGRRWVLKNHQILNVGAKKEERFAIIQAEIVEVGDDFYKVKMSRLDPKTRKILGEPRINRGTYNQARDTYSRLNAKETQISEEIVTLAGKQWRTKVYRNRRIVDSQEQILTIWNAVDYPGLAIKMVFKSPRRSEEGVLLEFQDGKQQ